MSTPVYPWTRKEVELIKALYLDTGGRKALELIVERLGNLNGPSFDNDVHVTAFNEGRRFVARELLSAINLPIEALINEETHAGQRRIPTATERAERIANGEQLYTAFRRR